MSRTGRIVSKRISVTGDPSTKVVVRFDKTKGVYTSVVERSGKAVSSTLVEHGPHSAGFDYAVEHARRIATKLGRASGVGGISMKNVSVFSLLVFGGAIAAVAYVALRKKDDTAATDETTDAAPEIETTEKSGEMPVEPMYYVNTETLPVQTERVEQASEFQPIVKAPATVFITSTSKQRY